MVKDEEGCRCPAAAGEACPLTTEECKRRSARGQHHFSANTTGVRCDTPADWPQGPLMLVDPVLSLSQRVRLIEIGHTTPWAELREECLRLLGHDRAVAVVRSGVNGG